MQSLDDKIVVERRQSRKSDRILVVLAGITGALAILALIATLALARIEIVQSRHDSCKLLREVVTLAIPPDDPARTLLTQPPLNNCHKYAGGFLP